MAQSQEKSSLFHFLAKPKRLNLSDREKKDTKPTRSSLMNSCTESGKYRVSLVLRKICNLEMRLQCNDEICLTTSSSLLILFSPLFLSFSLFLPPSLLYLYVYDNSHEKGALKRALRIDPFSVFFFIHFLLKRTDRHAFRSIRRICPASRKNFR